MYCYIYDSFLNQKKYEKQLSKIELFLADLGIGGRIHKLNVLKNLEELISEEINGGTKNLIVVGNDQTVSRVLDFLVGKNVALGIIPMGENNALAESIGIGSPEDACKIISARLIGEMDVGKINEQYFLMGLEVDDHNVIFNFKEYNINPRENNNTVGICNINTKKYDFNSRFDDGVMEAVFIPGQQSWWQGLFNKKEPENAQKISIFPIKTLEIEHRKKPVNIIIDGQRTIKTPARIEVLKRKLKIIMGKSFINNI
ncbi:hypothetical protein GYA54_01435 [Candidatus Kuenenbacteria bacterium]|nr:hypothetical protein [Candidatus Kuenenbacteria bacterium]